MQLTLLTNCTSNLNIGKKNGKMAEKKEKMYAYDALIESTVKQQTLQPLSEMRK